MNSVITETQIDAAYRAAHDEAILVDHDELNILRFTGETRLDLLNRMSTQKVIDLVSGQGAATVLTSDIGRIIDRLILYAASESVYCLTSENNGDNIAQYLMRFVFFMDDFQVVNLSEDTAIFGIYGCQSQGLLASHFSLELDLPIHHWIQTTLGDSEVTIHRTDPIAGQGYFVMCDLRDKELVRETLVDSGLISAGNEAFEYLRIESRRPRYGRELTLDYIPLETGLWDDVSFNKGCYTGQEIIARMESRGRLAKKLVLLQLEDLVEPGTDLQSGGKNVGTITSISDGPAGVLSLGYVKTKAIEDGEPLLAGAFNAAILEPST
jgi:folate-binding protein YgfZ